MIKSIFIMSTSGEVLIERHYRGNTSRTVTTHCWELFNNHGEVPPITQLGDAHVVTIQKDTTLYLAVVNNEISPLFVIEFLHRIANIFRQVNHE